MTLISLKIILKFIWLKILKKKCFTQNIYFSNILIISLHIFFISEMF